ncbi:MAG: hypothetical protein HRT58_07460 [Crocinitomicaceae bacterium]|nr:hypothetical protein [Flavobacteriales bacterium]NQZ35486.1 hypothetical protein [Crocinitomicaceae bacterium]
MIRLLFIPFIAMLMFSCESDSKKVDPLFYQISVADSTRCMNEIFGKIRSDAQEDQRRYDYFVKKAMWGCGLWSLGGIEIEIDDAGKVMIDNLDSLNVTECIVGYFLFNRNLTEEETAVASMDPNHPGFNFPFYNNFGLEEIQRRIKKTQNQADDIMSVDGADSVLVEYYASKVDEWKLKLIAFELLDGKTFDQISPQARVRVYHQKVSKLSKKVLNEIVLAFYQVRNYECMRYFNETYLSLYDRAQNKTRKTDLEKLDVLEMLHPAKILDNYWETQPVLQTPLPEK